MSETEAALRAEIARLQAELLEQRIKPGVRRVIAVLHKRAATMNHEPAKQWLNSLAFELGVRLNNNPIEIEEATEASLSSIVPDRHSP